MIFIVRQRQRFIGDRVEEAGGLGVGLRAHRAPVVDGALGAARDEGGGRHGGGLVGEVGAVVGGGLFFWWCWGHGARK